MYNVCRADWKEMKKVYCDLQKAHMKQLKSERSGDKETVDGNKKKKGFVANCLLKVVCSGEGGADFKQLKVCTFAKRLHNNYVYNA